MHPQIEFKHVLGELSVNRNDPCEVIRELISNSYDAKAKNIFYAPLKTEHGFIFFDDGSGLNTATKSNGITPYEAFFSIGKSTKQKGEAIGYKCQGSKLCFACSRIFVATKTSSKLETWQYKSIDNPRKNLDPALDISPEATTEIITKIKDFLQNSSSDTQAAIGELLKFISASESGTGTLIIIDNLDTENFSKYFQFDKNIEESYIYNYVRFCTKHGDIRSLKKTQGYSANQVTQVSQNFHEANLTFFGNQKTHNIPFGFPYLDVKSTDPDVKSPSQVSRLRDGRFYSRASKRFSIAGSYFSIVMAIDGNRRAHDDYPNLDRKGKTKSGVRLSDQRGFFISVNGIKICRYMDMLTALDDYSILAEGESPSHYTIIIDGDFDLVTNRNSLSKKAFDTLTDPDLLREIRKFLDQQRRTDRVFSELISRLRRESTENKLNEQIEILDESKAELKSRERFRIKDLHGNENLFLSPQSGEEYLVGVLYASLHHMVPTNSPYRNLWKRIATFSTQGIDSLAFDDPNIIAPLAEKNILSIEYKYSFSNTGPFNHALAIVDYIVAWEVELTASPHIKDSFTCFGTIAPKKDSDFEWQITDIESDESASYSKTVHVISLKKLIEKTFNTKYITPVK